MVSVAYALVPGMPEAHSEGYWDVDAKVLLRSSRRRLFQRVRGLGGYRDATPGKASTEGGFGPFPIFEDTREVCISLSSAFVTPADVKHHPHRSRKLGSLVVSLPAESARWLPRTA